jgi:hypothetical protein
VLSARRADRLLREKLFERVYAVRVPGFARLFGKAELDMHFSLAQDLRDLHGFLRELRGGRPAARFVHAGAGRYLSGPHCGEVGTAQWGQQLNPAHGLPFVDTAAHPG